MDGKELDLSEYESVVDIAASNEVRDYPVVEVEGNSLSEWSQHNPTAAIADYLYGNDPSMFDQSPADDMNEGNPSFLAFFAASTIFRRLYPAILS